MKAQALKTRKSASDLPNFTLQRKCACGTHATGGECALCGKNRRNSLQRSAVSNQVETEVPPIVHEVLRWPGQRLAASTRAVIEPRLGHDFSHVRVHTDMRGRGISQENAALLNDTDYRCPLANRRSAEVTMSRHVSEHDQRFGREIDDPVHQPMIDAFRQQQGQPARGVDEQGNQIAPTDAEIKYRPQPIAVLNGPSHAPIDTAATAGMEIQITVRMSSNDAELPFVQDSEVVGTSFDHTGSCATLPSFASSNSTFMPAANIPNDRHQSARALIIDRADNYGGSGSYARHQLDIYNHARYGIFNAIAIPNSGYRITRSIIAGPGTRLRFRVDKTPEACTVRGFSTTAGPSPAQHDEVVIRP